MSGALYLPRPTRFWFGISVATLGEGLLMYGQPWTSPLFVARDAAIGAFGIQLRQLIGYDRLRSQAA
jgi:hypothetical protein